MSQGDESEITVDSVDPNETSRCLVCGAGTDIQHHTLTIREGRTCTVSLCMNHHQYVCAEGVSTERTMAAAETEKVTARIPTALLEELDRTASEHEVPRSELIRDCLRDGLRAANTTASADDFLVAVIKANQYSDHRHDRSNQTDAGEDYFADRSMSDSQEDVDIEFLKQRITKLEQLLELALK